jgi:hypothetical protein
MLKLNEKNQRNIEIWNHITRNDLRSNQDKIFLFGDNLEGKGYGGQAKEMRGEENAIGVPTKKAPNNNPTSFFTDKEFVANKIAIDEAFNKIPPEKTLVIPGAGLGTGLAHLAEKAPQTYAYLNEKLAEIGFNNLNKETAQTLTAKFSNENKVVVQNPTEYSPTAKRLLDLNNIQTSSLKPLSPTKKEIDAVKTDRKNALAEYADRLRGDYKENKGDFRDGLKLLSDSLDKGEQITVTCSCRNGEMCHADVVKMAIEKVNLHIKNQQLQETNRIDRDENSSRIEENTQKQDRLMNPRTQRAINEILAVNEHDLLLEKINQTDGRNRSEQASYLGKSSQFIRDIYERGASIVGGKLILPQEKLTISEPLAITTQDYAVKRIGNILKDESKAKEIAPDVIEYANKIAGVGADGATKLKVFNWIYDSLEGKIEILEVAENERNAERATFDETLSKISFIADEMYALERSSKMEFTDIIGIENNPEETFGRVETVVFERMNIGSDIPKIPSNYSEIEIEHLINEVLPEIDQKLENGVAINEILKPFNETIRQSGNENAFRKLEKIYQVNGNPESAAESINAQLERIELYKQNVIELTNPHEFHDTQAFAIKTFYRKSLQESARVISKLDDFRELSTELKDKTEEKQLKKELNRIQESKPSFAFKINGSREIIIGTPSAESVAETNFVASYINFQLRQPESKLRHENERYRSYALQIEGQTTKSGLAKTASEIRAENASIGLKWKDLEKTEKEKQLRPLTQKEMQFLFTESSPPHFTTEMTALKLSFSHTGASRHSMTESLQKEEIKPSLEATKLVESLESRLNRRDVKDSISATRHFFESLKTPNESLKYKNNFDHQKIYTSLPPFEKDFVYQKATENLSKLKMTADKPLSLRIFEREFEKAEKELLAENLAEKSNEKLNDNRNLDTGFNRRNILKSEEREQIRATAIDLVKEKFEPKELIFDNPKLPTELTRQAIMTYKQLERASHVFQTSADRLTIQNAFSELDRETASLSKIRLRVDYHEKLSNLQSTINGEVVDLLKSNNFENDSNLTTKIAERLEQHLIHSSINENEKNSQIVKSLSEKISEKIQDAQTKLAEYPNRRTNESHELSLALESSVLVSKTNYESEKRDFVQTR